MIFEWDENKAKINFAKHKVTFEEAQTVFYDEEALLIADENTFGVLLRARWRRR